jgi:hypothetical protein
MKNSTHTWVEINHFRNVENLKKEVAVYQAPEIAFVL